MMWKYYQHDYVSETCTIRSINPVQWLQSSLATRIMIFRHFQMEFTDNDCLALRLSQISKKYTEPL